MTRKRELIITLSGGFLCLFFLGGFALTILPMDEATYADKVFPFLQGSLPAEELGQNFEAVKTLSTWFAVTLLVVLALIALASFFLKGNRNPGRAGIILMVAGGATLIGTQLVAFPLAFLFFLAAALCFFRKQPNRKGVTHA
ncbi:hypothetical protein ANABIO32_14400 [Rossellomorea marisflavi]|uniref:DUF4064 domain-containing protein n=1 Tax=Rossellomorea marisflavi TaxID=189381 RepID=UPI0025C976C8|nr:DUF4064 domain-containing protein [Rossellomorea marisflavi]GLI83743.1 hypothetical protein ANABIO32_14400 [Rossellomorea marisflavi]